MKRLYLLFFTLVLSFFMISAANAQLWTEAFTYPDGTVTGTASGSGGTQWTATGALAVNSNTLRIDDPPSTTYGLLGNLSVNPVNISNWCNVSISFDVWINTGIPILDEYGLQAWYSIDGGTPQVFYNFNGNNLALTNVSVNIPNGGSSLTFGLSCYGRDDILNDSEMRIDNLTVSYETTPPDISSCSITPTTTFECAGVTANHAAADAWNAANIAALGSCATDVCGISVTSTYNWANLSDGCGDTGSMTVVYTVSDTNGNQASTTATFDIVDTTPPGITAASDETVDCDGAGNAADLSAWLTNHGGATSSDVCSTVTWSTDPVTPGISDGCGATGSVAVTFIATDGCGLQASTVATFTVQDVDDPVFTFVPANTTVQCDGHTATFTTAFNTWLNSATATDVCSGTAVTITNDFTHMINTGCCLTGSVTVIWTAEDACGNQATASAVYTVIDTTPPVLTVPADVTVECDGSTMSATYAAWRVASATDVCCGSITPTYTESFAPGACCNTGIWTVVWTAIDGCGNSTMATRTFTIEDTTPPTILVTPNNLNYQCNGLPGNLQALVDWDEDNIQLLSQLPSVVDVCCNTWTVTSNFNIQNLSDACGNTGSMVVTYFVSDMCGNTATKSVIFVVYDDMAPVITKQAENKTVECDGAGNVTELNAWLNSHGGATALDQCGYIDAQHTGISWTHNYTSLSDGCGATGSAVVTFTVWDECNNSSTTSAVFTIVDTTNPVIACPAAVTVTCASDVPVAATTQAEFIAAGGTVVEACSGPVAVASVDNTTPGMCANKYTIARVYTLTDACGHAVSCTQTINVYDNVAPTWIPTAGSLDVSYVCASQVVEPALPTASDNCSGNTVTVVKTSDVTTPGVCANKFVRVLTYAASDGCGNTSVPFTITITVNDNVAPTWIPAPGSLDVSYVCASQVVEPALPTASDNCSGNTVTVVKTSDVTTPGACANKFVRVLTYVASDGCGNSSVPFTITITVNDNVAPTWVPATGSLDVSYVCASQVVEPALPTATDNCTLNVVTVTKTSDVTTPGACANKFTRVLTYTATDGCGNTSTPFTITITVNDNVAPTWVPAAGALNVNYTCASQVVEPVMPTATDNCTLNSVTVTKTSDVTTPGVCANKFTRVLTYVASDGCGNSSAPYTITITVNDNVAPTWVPAVGALNASYKCSSQVVVTPPTATDNCSGNTVVVSPVSDVTTPGICANRYVRVITYQATDGCGNTSIPYVVTITVFDDVAPDITTQAQNLTVECDGLGNGTDLTNWLNNHGGAIASDNCGGTVSWTHNFTALTPGCCNTGSATVTFTAWDACGNSKTTVATFTIVDTKGPKINCILPSLTYECKGLELNMQAAEDWNQDNILKLCCQPNVSDVCCANWKVYSDYSYDNMTDGCGNTGSITVIYTVEDLCGNKSTTTAVFTLKDSYAPTFTRPADITINAAADCSYNALPAVTGDVTNEADMCSPLIQATYTDTVTTGSCAGKKVITRTWNLTDGCNAAAPQVQTITVLDVTAPVLTVPSNTQVQCDGLGNTAAFEAWWKSATAVDACVGSVTPTVDPVWTGTCCNAGVWAVTFTATDPCTNSTSQVRTFTIVDTTAPEFTAPPAITIYTDANCGTNSSTSVTGDVTDEWDLCCSGPKVEDGDDDEPLDSPSIPTLNASYSDAVANGSCAGSKVITRTWTLVDGCGNQTVKTQVITVLDNIKPTVYARTSATPLVVKLVGVKTAGCTDCLGKWTLDAQNIYDLTMQGTASPTADNCSSYSQLKISVTPNAFLCADATRKLTGLDRGVNPVVVRVEDACGNVTTATSYVKVIDDIAPTMSCKNITVTLDATGKAFIFPADLNNGDDRESVPALALTYNGLEGGSWDACGIDSAWVSVRNFDCSKIGPNVVTLYMGDPSAKYWTGTLATNKNVGTCTATVMVVDNIPPVVAAVGNVVTTVAPGVCSTKVAYPAISASDVCGTTSTLVSGLGANGMFPLGTSTEVWLTTDGGGNAVTTAFTVTVNTTNAEPTINQVANVSLSEDSAPATVQLAGIGYGNDCAAQTVAVTAASSNTDLVAIALNYTPGDATGSIVHTFAPNKYGSATITVTVKDNSGAANDTKVMSFLVTVLPVNDPPFLVTGKALPDVQIYSAHTLDVAIPSTLGAYFDDIDMDALTLTVTLADGSAVPSWVTVAGGKITMKPLIYNMGTYTIKVTAKDPSGATASDEFKVEVLGYMTGIDPDASDAISMKAYPNPTRGLVTVEISKDVQDVDVSVWNAAGQQIMRKQYTASRFSIDLSGQVSGMYYIRCKTGNHEEVSKIVLEK